MKCTYSDVSLVLSRSQYVHENTEFSLQSFSSKQILLLLRSFRVCDRKPIFAQLRGSGHMFVLKSQEMGRQPIFEKKVGVNGPLIIIL